MTTTKKIVISTSSALALFSPLSARAVDCTFIAALCPNGNNIYEFIGNVANWMVGIFGSLFVLMVVIAGVQMASSGDSPDRLKAAKSRLTNAIIALVLLISFRAILAFVGITIN